MQFYKLNIYFFCFMFKNFIKFSIFYSKIDLDNFIRFQKLLGLSKLQIMNTIISKEKKFNKLKSKSLAIEGRIQKKNILQKFDILNISEFVSKKQKEIYLITKKRKTLFLNQNLILHKKFIFETNNLIKLNKTIENYFLKIKNLGNFFFIQYRIFGLGFKIKKSSFQNFRALRFEIGYGHSIYYSFSTDIKCLRRKRRFFIFSLDSTKINYIKRHINMFKMLNPYKIRGLKDLKHQIKMKKGKKQTKK